MRLREFRREDAPRFFALLKTEFPEEERILGMRPEGFEQLLRRLYRADLRLLLGILHLFRRDPFHLYVVEEDGAIVGTTLLAFGPHVGFLSTVVVAPAYRRRGFARQMLDAARQETARRRKPYVALGVLAANAPARALYGSIGYTELNRQMFMVHDAPGSVPAPAHRPEIRPFRASDASALAELSNRQHSERTRAVLPVEAKALTGGNFGDRLFSAETSAWVVDRGSGPEAHVSATVSPLTEAGHLSSPIVADAVPPELAADLVRTATVWLASRHAPRIATNVYEENRPGHRALEEAGFHDALPLLTLYRASG